MELHLRATRCDLLYGITHHLTREHTPPEPRENTPP